MPLCNNQIILLQPELADKTNSEFISCYLAGYGSHSLNGIRKSRRSRAGAWSAWERSWCQPIRLWKTQCCTFCSQRRPFWGIIVCGVRTWLQNPIWGGFFVCFLGGCMFFVFFVCCFCCCCCYCCSCFLGCFFFFEPSISANQSIIISNQNQLLFKYQRESSSDRIPLIIAEPFLLRYLWVCVLVWVLHRRACFSQCGASPSCVTWMKHSHYKKGRSKQLQVGAFFLIPHIILRLYKITQFWLCMQGQHYFKTGACSSLAGVKLVLDIYNWTKFLFPQLNNHSTIKNLNITCTLASWAWERTSLYKLGIDDIAFIYKSFSPFPILTNKIFGDTVFFFLGVEDYFSL